MRTVFTNDMCAHVFVQQTQDYGRSGSTSFRGPVFYSYHTAVARIVKFPRKCSVLLVTDRKYSVTTSGHLSNLRSAWFGHGMAFQVPDIEEKPDHKRNLKHLCTVATEWAARMKRMRRHVGEWAFDWLRERTNDAHAYARVFRLKCRLDFEAMRADIVADIERRRAKRETPAYLRAQARKEAQRLERERLERAARIERERVMRFEGARALEAWKRGTGSAHMLPYIVRTDENGCAHLRMSGDIVQTSLGAEVPVEDARRLFHVVTAYTDAERTYERVTGGPAYTVGHFTLISIGHDYVQIGCHKFSVADIRTFAASLGW